MKRRFVLINDTGDYITCLGIYEDGEKAIGAAIMAIWEDSENYEDVIGISMPYDLEAETGIGITETRSNGREEQYFILFFDEEERSERSEAV